MRGEDQGSGSRFSYVDLEARVAADHPLGENLPNAARIPVFVVEIVRPIMAHRNMLREFLSPGTARRCHLYCLPLPQFDHELVPTKPHEVHQRGDIIGILLT